MEGVRAAEVPARKGAPGAAAGRAGMGCGRSPEGVGAEGRAPARRGCVSEAQLVRRDESVSVKWPALPQQASRHAARQQAAR